MDTVAIRSTQTYKLVNNETGKVEAENMRRQEVMEERNLLWARGVKTTLMEE